MSFVANGVNIPNRIVLNSGDFFPEISLDEIRHTVRIDGTVSDQRLKQITQEEIIDVNRLLQRLTINAQSLTDYATSTINEKSDVEILYFSAISNGVYARLVEKYIGYDSSNMGLKKGEILQDSADDYRRNKHWAIQQLLGQSHTVVDLI